MHYGWLLRPACIGLLLSLSSLAWHYRPVNRETRIPVWFADYKSGFINDRGPVAITGDWSAVWAFDKGGLARVMKGGVFGAIDRSGKIIIPIEWNILKSFDGEGMAVAAKKSGELGCINRPGQIKIPLIWDDISPFDDKGLARVIKNRKRGFINRQGEIVIPLDAHFVTKGFVAKAYEWMCWLLSRPIGGPFALCHVYDIQGTIIWSSDTPPFAFILAAFGAIVSIGDLGWWATRRWHA